MSHRYAAESIDRYFRELTGLRLTPMGGKCVVFGGDFRQVLPVVDGGDHTAAINASLKTSYLWKEMRPLTLSRNMRAATTAAAVANRRELGNRTYAEWLLALGEGRLPHVTLGGRRFLPEDLIEIPETFHCPSVERLLAFVYDEGFAGEGVGERAVLCPTNASVNEINGRILESLGGEARTYVSVDTIKTDGAEGDDDEFQIREEVLNSLNIAGLPPHELTLKVGAVVVLMKNLDVNRGECNGTRLRVVELGDHYVECVFLAGERRGRTVILPRVQMIGRDRTIPREIVRIQFPIRLAFAMTINKSQGQTFRKVDVYLEAPCFGHGQLYVAFSRVGVPENVRICIENGEKQGTFRHRMGRKFTRNVVYSNVVKHGGEGRGVGGGGGGEEGDRRRGIVEEGGDRRGGREGRSMRELITADEIASPAIFEPAADRVLDVERMLGDEEENEFLALVRIDEEGGGGGGIGFRGGVYGGDPYVDGVGRDRPIEFTPVRNRNELLARVSELDRPGTSGAGIKRVRSPSPPSDVSLSD